MPLSFQRSSPSARRRNARRWWVGLVLLAVALSFWIAQLADGTGSSGLLGQTGPGEPTQPAGSLPTATEAGANSQPPAQTNTPGGPPAGSPPALAASSPSPTLAAPPTPSPTPPPVLISHLLFLSEGRLGRWDPASGRISPLEQPASQQALQQVVDYSVSQNGRWIAMLRQMGVTPEGPHDLILLDTTLGRMETLVEGTSRLHHIQISPNGAWIAYTTQPAGGNIHALEVTRPGTIILLGRCLGAEELRCNTLPVWAWDSTELYWSDERGVLRARVQDPLEEEILPGSIQVEDPRGQTIQVEVSYTELEPSPVGRYLLAQASPDNSEVTWQALVDTRIVRVVEVPGTYQFQDIAGRAGWMDDGRLFEVVPDPQQDESLALRIWRVVPTRDDLLLVQSEWHFSVTGLLPDMYAGWIDQQDLRYVSFVMRPAQAETAALLLRLDLRFRNLAKINELPYNPRQVWWSPDNRGALAAGPEGETWFAPADGSSPYRLTELLGRNLGDFTWLPPVNLEP